MDFCLSPYDHHWTAFIAQPSINMSNPDDLKSVFEDSSDIKMEDLYKSNHTLKLKKSLQSLKPIRLTNQHKQCPSLLLLSNTYGTHCGFWACIEWYCYFSSSFLLTHYFLYVYDPESISFGRGHLGSWEGNTLWQGRSKGSWPLLDHLPYRLHRSWVLNLSWPRSCDRP